MTLSELAEKTNLSVSYLSLLERGLNSPTVENLNKVCYVLNLTLSDLIMKMESGPAFIVRGNKRTTIFSGDGFSYESATDGVYPLSCIVMTVSNNEVHDSSPHITDEIGYIVSGSLIINVEGTDHKLFAGDSIYIEAKSAHSYRKSGSEPCVSIWFSYATSHAEIRACGMK